jgi:DNA repair exonuclease SbcCD ATPase subunit
MGHVQSDLELEAINLRSSFFASYPAGTEDDSIQALAEVLDNDIRLHGKDEASTLPSALLIERELEEWKDSVEEAEAALREIERKVRWIADEMSRIRVRSEFLMKELGAPNVSQWEDFEAGLLRELVGAEKDSERALAAIGAARSEKESAEEQVNLAKQVTALADVASLSAVSAVRMLERRWVEFGLSLPPSSDGVVREIEKLESCASALERRIDLATAAIVGIQRWLELEQINGARRQLDDEAGQPGAEGWAAHGARLAQAVRERQRDESLAKRASTTVKAMKTEAGTKRSEMRGVLTSRLTPFLGPLLRTLLMNPDVGKATLELGESRSKTQVNAVTCDKIPLVAVASEGQLAGVNLAVQLAMAQAFPWSRWRALLLDDPSQFSDVVHSASLIETLRMLARRQRFQIILSTHERDFAKYVCRKFENEGLATTRIAFREPPSDGGIVPRVVSSWNSRDCREGAAC